MNFAGRGDGMPTFAFNFREFTDFEGPRAGYPGVPSNAIGH
jgi:hypothetical protein